MSVIVTIDLSHIDGPKTTYEIVNIGKPATGTNPKDLRLYEIRDLNDRSVRAVVAHCRSDGAEALVGRGLTNLAEHRKNQ